MFCRFMANEGRGKIRLENKIEPGQWKQGILKLKSSLMFSERVILFSIMVKKFHVHA